MSYTARIGETEIEVDGYWIPGCRGDYDTPDTPASFQPETFYKGDKDVTKAVERLDKMNPGLIDDIASRISEDHG